MKVKLGLSDQDAEKGGEPGREGSQTGENFKISFCNYYFYSMIAKFSKCYDMVEVQKIQYLRNLPMSHGVHVSQKAYHGVMLD